MLESTPWFSFSKRIMATQSNAMIRGIRSRKRARRTPPAVTIDVDKLRMKIIEYFQMKDEPMKLSKTLLLIEEAFEMSENTKKKKPANQFRLRKLFKFRRCIIRLRKQPKFRH